MLSRALNLVLPASRALIPLHRAERPTGWLAQWTVGILELGLGFTRFCVPSPARTEAKATLAPQRQDVWAGSFHKHVAACLEMLTHPPIPAHVHTEEHTGLAGSDTVIGPSFSVWMAQTLAQEH